MVVIRAVFLNLASMGLRCSAKIFWGSANLHLISKGYIKKNHFKGFFDFTNLKTNAAIFLTFPFPLSPKVLLIKLTYDKVR